MHPGGGGIYIHVYFSTCMHGCVVVVVFVVFVVVFVVVVVVVCCCWLFFLFFFFFLLLLLLFLLFLFFLVLVLLLVCFFFFFPPSSKLQRIGLFLSLEARNDCVVFIINGIKVVSSLHRSFCTNKCLILGRDCATGTYNP